MARHRLSYPASDRAAAVPGTDRPPLVMHVVYRFGVGGLENGIVNLIERLPPAEFRHMVVALTECVPEFCKRITRAGVDFVSLHKPPGQGWQVFVPIWRLFRRHKPAIVHTRNLAALEMLLPAWAAGVPVRLHGEHGRDASDPDGTNRRFRWVRRVFSPFVTHYIAVSADLRQYLVDAVGVSPGRVTYICNGVDEEKFRAIERSLPDVGRGHTDARVVVGTVGRLDEIKDQSLLIAAVARLLEREPETGNRLRVQIVGEGPMRESLHRQVEERGLRGIVEFLGERDDVSGLMRDFDVFVLPSRAEGVSNTILEAMASALPVVATAVGGNPDLVTPGLTGALVPPSDPDALALAVAAYVASPRRRLEHGARARADVEHRFALTDMVERYRTLYRSMLAARAGSRFTPPT